MSVLPAEIHTELTELLKALQNVDNGIRGQAEEHLANNWTNTRPEVLLMGLVEQMSGSPDIAIRTFAAVIFRRIASKPKKDAQADNVDIFYSIPSEQRNMIRSKLLEALTNETSSNVRNKIGDAVAELARQYVDHKEQWNEVLGILFTLSNSADDGQREIAYRVFATTPQMIEKQYEDTVLSSFTKGFKDEKVSVRLTAMEAFVGFFRELRKKEQQKYYGLIPDVLNILLPIKESGDSDDLETALISLIELAEIAPKMFKPLFPNLVQFSVSIIHDKEFTDQARQNALELMATFADYAPAMCRKDESYTRDMITQCLSLMTDIGQDDDDAEEWNTTDDTEPDESDQNHVAGEQCMDRLANKLGGATVLAPTFQWLPRMMTSGSWRDRHAALMAISAISEGCRDLMVGELDKVLELVVPALRDPHSRVRWAGCNALGQMSTDFAGTMQKKYHAIVVPAIIPVLTSAEPRVQAHAAAALVNFCEEAEKTVLEPYLDNLLEHLFQLLQSPKKYVQEQALSTIATIADSAEAAFSKYYDTLMPLLFTVLQQETTGELRLLCAKAMECATLIALAVGKERLGQDAIKLVQLLASIQTNITEDDDPRAQYLMHCWGRMCRVLGKDFLPFLPGVMPPLLELASVKADIQLLDDQDQVEQMSQEAGWDLVPLKGKMLGIKTSALDDKHMAIELLLVYASVLEGDFAPYVADIMSKIAIPGLTFFFHDPVRVVSAKCIPQLLNSYKKAFGLGSSQLVELWTMSADPLLECLTAEPAVDTLADMYESFYESVEVMGAGCLSPTLMNKFIDSAQSALADYKERVQQRAEQVDGLDKDEGEEDPDDILFAIEDDQTLLSDMNKAFHCIFKHHGVDFLPAWERLLDIYNSFLKSEEATQRQWGICIIDDVIEFCGERSWHYSGYFIEPLANGCQDPASANRQAAAYGVGVAAQKGGAAWAAFLGAAMDLLFNATQIPSPRDETNVFATENCCAAIAKIMHFNASQVANPAQVVTRWIDTLPVTNDEEAAPYAYAYLAELIKQQNQAVLSQPDKVFTFIAQALEAETLQGTMATTAVEAAKQMLTITGRNPAQLMTQLDSDLQATVRAFFS